MNENSLIKLIELRISDSKPGYVFSAIDYTHIAELNTIHQILSRLEKDGKIKRVMQGLYYVPRFSELLQEYEEPSPNEIALAIARKNRWSIVPEGNTALKDFLLRLAQNGAISVPGHMQNFLIKILRLNLSTEQQNRFPI